MYVFTEFSHTEFEMLLYAGKCDSWIFQNA